MYNVIMKKITFEWDSAKNTVNIKKHGVSFDEAKTVFYDDNALLIPDPEHSISEERFVILGHSFSLKLLVVCHCYRKGNNIIRIISVRKATKKESLQYAEVLK